MGKKLAIKGHPTRGKEVVELLEMLGGVNSDEVYGNLPNNWDVNYYIFKDGVISVSEDKILIKKQFEIFTLEEFLEKYPFKVGDKVYIKVDPNANCLGSEKIYGVIESAVWVEKFGYVVYKLKDNSGIFYREELHSYEEVDMKDNKLFGTVNNSVETKSYTVSLKDGKIIDNSIDTSQFIQIGKTVAVCFNTENYENEVELKLGDYEIIVRDGKTYAVLKKPKYPIIYEDCCKVMGINYRTQLSYTNPDVERGNTYLTKEKQLLDSFMRLRICRNAYWKIAGEEMGLDKPWGPDWTDAGESKYCIVNKEGIIDKWIQKTIYKTLAFPTEEMRDAFYENFKDLIEQCKKLL